VAWRNVEWSCVAGPPSERTPVEIRSASAKTIVECPSENQKPTVNGRLSAAINLRVVLSIAEM
jgi:hypothetical protein